MSNTRPTATPCVIGLDVGGTKIAGGLVALPSGEILSRQTIPTGAARGGEAVLADAVLMAARFAQEAQDSGLDLLGIGIGVPELVDPEGNITSAHAIAWRDVPVAAHFTHLAPTMVESDVRAAAIAEAFFGAGQSFKLFAYITVGTGISYSLVQDGKVYTGARGNALVLASSPLTTICTHCGTLLHPILEEYAAGPALVTRYNAHAPGCAERGEDVIRAVEAGDAAAKEVVRTAGAALGTSTGFLVNVLDPEAIVVGGGLGQVGGLYWSSFIESTRQHIWADSSRDLPILRAGLGVDAGLIGAATAIWQRSSV